MRWEFGKYPSIIRARNLAVAAGLSGQSAPEVLFGLIQIAEKEELAESQLASHQVLTYLRQLPARTAVVEELPGVSYLWPPSLGRPWLALFHSGGVGWRLCRALGLDPDQVYQQLENSLGGQQVYWASDWKLLQELVADLEHPLCQAFWGRTKEALDWLEKDRPLDDRNALVPTRSASAPEPALADLIAVLARLPSVAQVYWFYGLMPPVYEQHSERAGRLQSLLPTLLPGRLAAGDVAHAVIHPIHQFLSGLREPRHQLDFAYARTAVGSFLSELPSSPRHSDRPRMADEAVLVLQKLAVLCSNLNVDPTPLHLTWAALKAPEPLLERALGTIDRDRLEMDLERELFGTLPDARLSIDGLDLGMKAEQLGPLQQLGPNHWKTQSGTHVHLDEQGKVTELQGQRLHCGPTTLIHPEIRPGELERLLGLGRLNRWTPIYGGLLKVDSDQGIVESVSMAE